MRIRSWLALLVPLSVGSCSAGDATSQDDTAAVYRSLFDDFCCASNILLQEVTDTSGLAPREQAHSQDWELQRFSEEMGEAVADLQRRSASVRLLPDSLKIGLRQRRLPADSTRSLLQRIQRDRLRSLPDSASVVLVSEVGFSRDRKIAVVRMMEVCGNLCGGVSLRAFRRHPGGWVPAERVWDAVF